MAGASGVKRLACGSMKMVSSGGENGGDRLMAWRRLGAKSSAGGGG